MKIFRFGVLPAILGIFLYAQNIAAAQADSFAFYTAQELEFYRMDDGQEIRIIHLQTNFCSTHVDKRYLCVEEKNICRAAFAHLKERLQAVVKDETFHLYGCGAEEMHVPSQKRNDALFIEYRLRMTEKMFFKQSVPFNIYVLRSVHKRWKDGEGYSTREVYPPFPIPETEDRDALRQDLLTRISYDMNAVVQRVSRKNRGAPVPRKRKTLAEQARHDLEIYGANPQKVLEKYLSHKKFHQRGNPRPDYLDLYENYLQEHGLIDPSLTREDLVRAFITGSFEMNMDNPDNILNLYNFYRHWLAENDMDFDYLSKYKEFLKEKGLLE